MSSFLDALRTRYNTFVDEHERGWELTFAGFALAYVAVGFAAEGASPNGQLSLDIAEDVLTTIFILEFLTRILAPGTGRGISSAI